MCPLRIILIFLSATLAGFFVLRGFKSQPQSSDDLAADSTEPQASETLNGPSKAGSALKSGVWTCVDMANGRYLWRHLVSTSASKRSD